MTSPLNDDLVCPRRRRSDADLSGRVAVLEAVQGEHRQLFKSLSDSLASLVRIESDNAIARVQTEETARDVDKIKEELPSMRLVRYLVYTATLAVLASAITFGWTVIYGAAKSITPRVESHANQ
jgi:hypothetical protein